MHPNEYKSDFLLYTERERGGEFYSAMHRFQNIYMHTSVVLSEIFSSNRKVKPSLSVTFELDVADNMTAFGPCFAM